MYEDGTATSWFAKATRTLLACLDVTKLAGRVLEDQNLVLSSEMVSVDFKKL